MNADVEKGNGIKKKTGIWYRKSKRKEDEKTLDGSRSGKENYYAKRRNKVRVSRGRKMRRGK